MTPQKDGGEVTLYVAEQVDPGYERQFEVWARSILDAATAHPGTLGTGLLPPADPAEPWHLLLHFRDGDAYRAWQHSPVRAACLAAAQGHHMEVARRELLGMEGWFASTAAAARSRPAPRWKMAAASTVAIAPLTLGANLYLTPHLDALPVAARSLLLAPVISVLMTYAALPLATRLLRRWLFPAAAVATAAPPRERTWPAVGGTAD
ncbi:antibiotic biosynthesis monooxygenase [Kitasatospora sp. NPDC002040]|uniref:antibiotic biosynthesis monooxygenase n=1 Tax=Kitasatospora sp. NPDC002040 TaxID=3154661 RepID=UPI003326C819